MIPPFLLLVVLSLILIGIIMWSTNRKNDSESYRYMYAASPQPSDIINILMIGNSFIYKNSMWKTLQTMLGSKYSIDRAAAPSLSLRGHIRQGDLSKILTGKRYDYIVLQENSGIPIKTPDKLAGNVERMISYINKYQPMGWKPILYETYSRCYTKDTNPERTQMVIDKAFRQASISNGCAVAEVGKAFMKFRQLSDFQVTDPILFNCTDKDVSHPSEMGSILTALVFYRLLTGAPAGSAPIFRTPVTTEFIRIVDSL